MIIMVVMKSNQDVVISAGGIVGLVHETFVTVSFYSHFMYKNII